ncbi:MAG: hypothetical protein K9L82_04980 [Chromatiaceae bacterium]|nr:hypothetical protein [Chromatiaceae bacterium]MCF7995064.1 hypothetical protein [Chromatiaceae bacterium]MCF8015953.1 hypothetical protein [Chromatiaceae bacterium]
MLGEMTPLEQTRAYREIVAKNQPIWLEEGRADLETWLATHPSKMDDVTVR